MQSERYIRLFCRLLRLNGLLIFQLPSHRADPTDALPRPMPDAAYRAKLHAASVENLTTDQTVTLHIEVTNRSGHVWAQSSVGAIRVGNHWRDHAGQMLVQDDGRALLPPEIRPGESAVVGLEVTAPPDSGAYLLELDAVHEGVTWFGDRGSSTHQQRVNVGHNVASGGEQIGSPADPLNGFEDAAMDPFLAESGPTDQTPAPFPMHGIPRARVIEILEAEGLAVKDVREDDHARPEWASFRYIGQRMR